MKLPTFTPTELTVWRIVRDGEGYSSTSQVMYRLKDRGIHELTSGHAVGGILKRLSTAGHLRQNKRWEGCSYGFTTACTVPAGESGTPFDPPGATATQDATAMDEATPIPADDVAALAHKLLAALPEGAHPDLCLMATITAAIGVAADHPKAKRAAAVLRKAALQIETGSFPVPRSTTH